MILLDRAATPEVMACFEVIEPGGRMCDDNAVPCRVGCDVVVDPARLGAYCLRDLPARVDDLVLLASAVAFADKSPARRVSRSWERRLHLSVPVLEPEFWSQRVVTRVLSDTLGLLTGDAWSFEFRPRRQPLSAGRQGSLPFGESPSLVMPFSNGLDSLAVARLTATRRPNVGLILVATGRLGDPDKDWRLQHLRGRYHRVSVPFKLARRQEGARFREQSYRSRAFVFGVMAGVAAYMLGAERILVSESGQGALGPWLTPVGNEAPDLRTHPTFTRRLAGLLSLVFDHRLRFEHPQLWATKGETLAELRERGLAEDWHRTRSCSRDARDVSLGGGRLQCGVCANCLLRRQSLMAAGLDEGDDRYLWSRLAEPSLGAAARPGARVATANDKRHASCGVLAMAELAALGRSDRHSHLHWAAEEVALALDEPAATVAPRLRRLLAAHLSEWQAFINAQGPGSFVAHWTEQALC